MTDASRESPPSSGRSSFLFSYAYWYNVLYALGLCVSSCLTYPSRQNLLSSYRLRLHRTFRPSSWTSLWWPPYIIVLDDHLPAICWLQLQRRGKILLTWWHSELSDLSAVKLLSTRPSSNSNRRQSPQSLQTFPNWAFSQSAVTWISVIGRPRWWSCFL